MKEKPSRYGSTGIEGEWQPASGDPLPLYNFSGRGAVKRKTAYLNAVIKGYTQEFQPLADFFRGCVEARIRELEA